MSYSSVIAADHPVVYFPFNGDSDNWGSASVTTSSSYTVDPAGIVGEAFKGNGSSTYFDIARMPPVFADNTASIEFWFKTPASPQRYSQALWLSAPSGGNFFQFFYYGPGNGSSSGIMEVTSRAPGFDALRSAVLPYDQWHHVVLTVNSGSLALFVNGVQTASDDGADVTALPTTTWYVGSRKFGTSNRSNVADLSLDEFAVYDHALTAGRVKAHYDAGMGILPDPVEPLDLSSGVTAESTWTALAAQVALADPAPAALVLSTGQVAEAVWKALGARVQLVVPVPTPLIVQSGTAAQSTFYGMRGRVVLTQPPAGQLTLIAGEQAEAIWQALAAQAGLTEPVFIPVGEWQLSAYMPKGEVMASMHTNSAEASMDKSQGNTRLNTNQIEAVMASKTLWPELKEEA